MSSSFDKNEEAFTCFCPNNYINVYYIYSIKCSGGIDCEYREWTHSVHIKHGTQEHFRNPSKTCSKVNMFLSQDGDMNRWKHLAVVTPEGNSWAVKTIVS